MKKKVTLYTKFCLNCYWPKQSIAIRQWAEREGMQLIVKRTAYRPDWHKEAVVLYGNADYTAFLVHEDGSMDDFVSFADKLRTKPFRGGRKKEVKNDMQGLRKTSRPNRTRRVARKKVETKGADAERKA